MNRRLFLGLLTAVPSLLRRAKASVASAVRPNKILQKDDLLSFAVKGNAIGLNSVPVIIEAVCKETGFPLQIVAHYDLRGPANQTIFVAPSTMKITGFRGVSIVRWSILTMDRPTGNPITKDDSYG